MNPTTSADALTQYQTAQSSAKGANDFVGEQNKALGVDQAQQQVSGLRQAITNTTNLLNAVPASVQGRTQDSLVTSAQAGRQVANEQAPLNLTLGQQNQDYAKASGDYTTLADKANTLASGEYNSQQDKLANFKSVYDSLYKQEQDALAAQLTREQIAASERNASKAAAGSAGASPNFALPGATTGTVDPVQQLAYNDVYTRVSQQSADQIKSDYLATLKSANYGNAKDKAKIAIYNQLGYNFAAPATNPVSVSNKPNTQNVSVNNKPNAMSLSVKKI